MRAPVAHGAELDHRVKRGLRDPFVILDCVPQSFPLDGHTTPVSPGQIVEYRVPDIFGRPWAEIWERYHEEGMERPREQTSRFGL